MLCSKFELIPTSIFRVKVIFKNDPILKDTLVASNFYYIFHCFSSRTEIDQAVRRSVNLLLTKSLSG